MFSSTKVRLTLSRRDSRRCRRSRSQGGVLVEFLITLPLLIVFLVGIVSSGRLLGTLASTGQAAFLGGVLVSEINNIAELDQVPSRVQKILCLQNRRLNNLNCGGNPPANLVRYSYNPAAVDPAFPGQANRVVKIDVHGDFQFMLKDIDLDLQVTAPLLLLDQLNPASLAQPANPAVSYGCKLPGNGATCGCCFNGVQRGDYCRDAC